LKGSLSSKIIGRSSSFASDLYSFFVNHSGSWIFIILSFNFQTSLLNLIHCEESIASILPGKTSISLFFISRSKNQLAIQLILGSTYFSHFFVNTIFIVKQSESIFTVPLSVLFLNSFTSIHLIVYCSFRLSNSVFSTNQIVLEGKLSLGSLTTSALIFPIFKTPQMIADAIKALALLVFFDFIFSLNFSALMNSYK
jgi:hypothetical protein